MTDPKLRTAEKIKPPYPLGRFPGDFPYKIGKEIIYKLITEVEPTIEGPEWERIFAQAINAKWKPSNVGLDDIVLGVCAWGAKTVKNANPFKAKKVRLISGRNSPAFSYKNFDTDADPAILGEQVLGIWNTRVESLRNKFSHLRTVVLVKGKDLREFVVFESETVIYPPENFEWSRNKRNNLEGKDKHTLEHRFTWQPHGSQFTIIEPVPDTKLCFKLKRPPKISSEKVLKAIGYHKSWVVVVKPED